jgi:hypothetical protein
VFTGISTYTRVILRISTHDGSHVFSKSTKLRSFSTGLVSTNFSRTEITKKPGSIPVYRRSFTYSSRRSTASTLSLVERGTDQCHFPTEKVLLVLSRRVKVPSAPRERSSGWSFLFDTLLEPKLLSVKRSASLVKLVYDMDLAFWTT